MKFTQDTWAKLVSDAKDIPQSFTKFFQKIDQTPTPFPYTVYAPPDRGYRHKSNPKLICLYDDRIYIAEKIKKQVVSHCFIFDDINYIEMGKMLLHSWLKINGAVDGQLSSIRVEYNTVVEGLFIQIQKRIRATLHNLEKTDNSEIQFRKEQQKFDYLSSENYKYMNYGKDSLLPGTEVYQILLQPDIRVKFWKYFMRTISFVHQTILTDKELIIIKDEDGSKMGYQMRYGGIWRYIPLNKINKLDVINNMEGDLYTLSVYLPENVTISNLFTANQKPQLDLLRNNFERSSTFPVEIKRRA